MASAPPRFRDGAAADIRPAYAVFRRSLWNYLRRIGYLGPEDPIEPEIEEAWGRQGAWMEHLARTAARFVVAETEKGRIIGYARATERGGLVELTEFFVHPEAQAGGVGRGLLDRTIPLGWGKHRSIIATQDPGALSLYLRYGVRDGPLGLELTGRPRDQMPATDLDFTPATLEDAPTILELEEQILGFARPEDVSFLMSSRVAWIARRRGRPVGYGFGGDGTSNGPVAVLDATDLQPLLAHLEAGAARAGSEEWSILATMRPRQVVHDLLGRGFRIDRFYVLYLMDEPFVPFDRYLSTAPGFIL